MGKFGLYFRRRCIYNNRIKKESAEKKQEAAEKKTGVCG